MPWPTLAPPLLVALLLALTPLAAAQTPIPDELLALSNEARADEGLAPLRHDPGLARAARGHAEELAERRVMTHESEDPARRTPSQRVGLAGVALVEVGENLAMIEGEDVAGRTVRGWTDSPPHRENLMNGAYTHVGHAVVAMGDVHWVVQVLGARPLSRLGASASVPDATTDTVAIEVRYDAPDAPLALFVDGAHQPEAHVEPGVLRARHPRPDRPVEVSVGIDRGNGTARVVERFTLRPGTPPTLVPGTVEESP